MPSTVWYDCNVSLKTSLEFISSSRDHSICSPLFLQNLPKGVFWTCCSRYLPSLSGNCSIDIHPNDNTKQPFSRSPMSSTLLSQTVGSQVWSFLSSQQHWAQLDTPQSLHICTHTEILSIPLGVSSDLTDHPVSPITASPISLTLKCLSAQDPVQGPLSFPAVYIICKTQCRMKTLVPCLKCITVSNIVAAEH